MMNTLIDTAAAVAERAVSPLELVEEALAALELVQRECNAFTVVRAEEALASAAELGDLDPVGPLHGVPIVVKDLYDVAGVRTTGCCAAYLERDPAATDSAVVARLHAAGAIVIAKTNQHELACGATSQVSCFGPVLNPWNTAHIPGGSSGGSAVAVAARVVMLGMGSDTGGSIRIPASMCGVTGLKPTHGAVSLRGAMPMIPAHDSGGPLAVTVEDCLLVHRLLAGFDDADPYSRVAPAPRPLPDSIRGLRLGIPRLMYSRIDPEVHKAVDGAMSELEKLGLVVVEVEGPDPHAGALAFDTRWAEVANCYRDLWDDDRPSDYIKRLLAIGRESSGPDVARAMESRRLVQRQFRRAFEHADVLLAPTVAYPAPPVDAEAMPVEGGTLDVKSGGAVRLTLPVNVGRLPALSIPVGFSSLGLPIGAQLIGPEFSEELLCAIGSAFQQETDWHRRFADLGGA